MNLGHPDAAPAIVGPLKLVGWTTEELALTGAHLCITATANGKLWNRSRHFGHLLLRWRTKEAADEKVQQHLASVMASGNAGVAELYYALNKIGIEDRLLPDCRKAQATRSDGRLAWEHLKDVVQPPPRRKLPILVKGGPGGTSEMAMDLKLEQVRSPVRNSGKLPE